MNLLTLLRVMWSMHFANRHFIFHHSPSINWTWLHLRLRLVAKNPSTHRHHHRFQSLVIASMIPTSDLPMLQAHTQHQPRMDFQVIPQTSIQAQTSSPHPLEGREPKAPALLNQWVYPSTLLWVKQPLPLQPQSPLWSQSPLERLWQSYSNQYVIGASHTYSLCWQVVSAPITGTTIRCALWEFKPTASKR